MWALSPGAPNPVILPDQGYLSDPDLVYVPERDELWLYYRQVTSDNIIHLIRTRDGRQWTSPVTSRVQRSIRANRPSTRG